MKKKFIYILIIIAVILLLANVTLNWINKKEPVQTVSEISTHDIDSLFSVTIDKFNLDSTWVNTVAINSNQYDSLKKVYKVKLPNDLRPAVVLLEIKKIFNSFDVELISDEKVVNGQTTLNILSNDKLKLQANLTIENDLERAHSKFAFVLRNFNETTPELRSKLYHSIIPFCVLLEPSSESDSLIEEIFDYKKTYSVLIDDGIENDNYKLQPDLSKTRLKESVRYISWNYPASELMMINNKSQLFTSAIFNLIRDEFRSRDITLYMMNDFISLPNNIGEAESLMKFYLESGVGKEGKVILVDAKIYNDLLEMLNLAKQKGAKFYSPLELINLNSEEEQPN